VKSEKTKQRASQKKKKKKSGTNPINEFQGNPWKFFSEGAQSKGWLVVEEGEFSIFFFSSFIQRKLRWELFY
jgi:hypothetical protein